MRFSYDAIISRQAPDDPIRTSNKMLLSAPIELRSLVSLLIATRCQTPRDLVCSAGARAPQSTRRFGSAQRQDMGRFSAAVTPQMTRRFYEARRQLEPLPQKSPYKVLGLSKQSDPAEIKTAFRTLALRYHPDRHATIESSLSLEQKTKLFKEVSEAYEWLADEKRRRRVDFHFLARGSGPVVMPGSRGRRDQWGEDPSVWRGPRPGWVYSPEARRWRQRFWILKGMVVVGFLSWGMILGNFSNFQNRRRVLAKQRQMMASASSAAAANRQGGA